MERSAQIIPLTTAPTELLALVERWTAEYARPSTATSYRFKLLGVIHGINAKHVEDLTTPALAGWLQSRDDRTNNTLRADVTTVRAFLRWAVDQGLTTGYDAKGMTRLLKSFPRTYGKVQAQNPARFLSRPEAFDALIPACQNGTPRGLRDEIAIRFGLLGMRRTEISTLTFQNLAASPEVHWTGKGRKPRTTTMGTALLAALADYREQYEAAIGRPIQDTDPIICPVKTSRYCDATQLRWGAACRNSQVIATLLARRASTANLGHVAPHDLRRTAASILHNDTTNGAHNFDLLDIQQVLGHADPATTMRCYLEPMNHGVTRRAATVLD